MALFVVQHRHEPETCPAQNPAMGAALLVHLAPDSARRFEVEMHGEAVVDGAHTLYLIAEAPDAEHLRRFMEPFAQAGSVEILPSSRCEIVVGRGRC